MNDLSGLDWNTTSSNVRPANNNIGIANPQPQSALRSQLSASASISRQSTPLSAPQSGRSSPAINPSNPGPSRKADSFANLLGQSNKAPAANTLQEKQKQLLAEKAREAGQQRQNYQDPFRSSDATFWDGFANNSGRASPNTAASARSPPSQDDTDLLAAFSASAPVDASTHFPPPSKPWPGSSTPAARPQTTLPSQISSGVDSFPDDDDPFGLGALEQKRPSAVPPPITSVEDDDDILGDLAKPVDTSAARPRASQAAKNSGPIKAESNPRDRAIAELVDMGFPVESAQAALAATETGTDVQAAVGYLLNQAHAASGSRTRSQTPGSRPKGQVDKPGRREQNGSAAPTWMREESQGRSQERPPAASGEKDVGQYASEIGNAFFKSANSLWKTGQKRVQKAMADMQHENNSGQPKWMREAQAREERGSAATPSAEEDATAEARALDSGRAPPNRRSAEPAEIQQRSRPPPSRQNQQIDLNSIDPSNTRRQQPVAPRERLNKQTVEEQSAQAYVSPARRRKAPTEPPKPSSPPVAEMDIFSDAPIQPAAATKRTAPAPERASPVPIPVRPKAPTRKVPEVSAAALARSAEYRQKGSEVYKRGDYAEAQTHYSNALSSIPERHPIAIIIRCNRALTNIKTGDPKAAIVDADMALSVIGVSRGEGETIDLGSEGQKSMKEFFGKALMRKAEAMEQMEKWIEAAQVWREAVEAGVGGSVAIQGKQRCEKASGTSKAAAAAPKRAAVQPVKRVAPTRQSAIKELQGEADSQAVKRLREANAAAAAASEEQFALTDSVNARLDGWKAGKKDNLRGLLASLDSVLWAEAGWKKVGMSDLVMPARVKVVYMKAIAKVHPDKIPQTATTEHKMISASVFATLNEAWDKFKKENGL